MTASSPEPQNVSSRTIRLHLVGSCPEPVIVCLRVPEGTAWAAARDAINDCGITIPDQLYAGDRPMSDDTELGRQPLVNGAQLSARPTAPESRHLLELVVTEGPEVGARTALGVQVQRIGRAPANTLTLQDPDLSRTHLIVGLDQGRAMVSDAGSTNGSHIDGRSLAAETPTELRAGQRLRAGSTTFALERSLTVDDAVATDESCRVPFQRAPESLCKYSKQRSNDQRSPPLLNDTNCRGR
ncbi:FHA domain-containing protein [Flexivirga alba]|uniref:FHA domain-containing protein n=1 Tax=Flexivirga alba TaxID=702742 RepID=A0ABW2AFM6_9MICO